MPDSSDDPADPPTATDPRREEIADKYRFDSCCTDAFDLVVAAWDRHLVGDPIAIDEVPVADIATALDHGPVGPSLIDWVLGDAEQGSPELDSFLTTLIDSTPPPHAATRFARAMNAEASGRVLDAEADLDAATTEDPTHAPSIYELARFASDRGDIERAVALYRRVGSGAQAEVDFLNDLLPDYGKIGRNDPCPCGSGRKFKQCHLAHPEVPPDRAALWLFQKVLGYAYREQFEAMRMALARAAADGALDPARLAETDADAQADADGPTAIAERMANEPFLLDLSVFDTRVMARFAAERSVLLPAAEAEMLQRWMATDRRLWELTDVDVGQLIVLRDVISGDAVEVPERVASKSLKVGGLLLTRVVDVHGSPQLIGQPLPISPDRRHLVTSLVERHAEPEEWARWFGTLLARSLGHNAEGEPIVIGAVVVRPGAGLETAAVLDQLYEASDEVDDRWADVVELDGDQIVRATLDVEGDGRIVITADSEPRLDRVLDALRAADPDLTIDVDERKPFDDSKVRDLIGK